MKIKQQIIRHGEVILKPINILPKNKPTFKAKVFISLFSFIPRPIETANASIDRANAKIKTSNIKFLFFYMKAKL